MLTLRQCRSLLGNSRTYDEAELKEIRESLYLLAQLLIDSRHTMPTPCPDTRPTDRDITLLEAADERAAIMQYDGELDRDDAELLAARIVGDAN